VKEERDAKSSGTEKKYAWQVSSGLLGVKELEEEKQS